MDDQRVVTRGTLPFTELASWTVDYQVVASEITPSRPGWTQVVQERLLELWRESYMQHHPLATELHDVSHDGGTFAFDSTWSGAGTGVLDFESIPYNRVVAAIGVSTAERRERPAGRIRGFPRGGLGVLFPKLVQEFDRGHHLAHAAGGGVDINLYPQLASVNRGRDEDGKLLRSMERYATRHEGTLVFSRPLYFGISDHPAAIDFGVVYAEGILRHEVLRNVRTLDHLRALDQALITMRTRGWSQWPKNGEDILEPDSG